MGRTSELKTGLLFPNGDFYPCGVYEHISLARKILNDEYANRADEKTTRLRICGNNSFTVGRKRMESLLEALSYRPTKNFLKPYFEDDVFPMCDIVRNRWERENDYVK